MTFYAKSMHRRLRDGTGFVTWPQPLGAPRAFADPSASITRWGMMTHQLFCHALD
jgi:hypothetical protein